MTSCSRSSAWSAIPAGVGERELAQVREAEPRLRAAWSSRSRAKVPVDPVGGGGARPSACSSAAAEVEKVRRGGGQARGVRGDRRSDHRGEREDLRGPAARPARTRPRRTAKKGAHEALAEDRTAEIGRLAAEAARSLGCGDAGLEAAEAVIRAGMLAAGCGMLGQLLAADPGHRGPRVPCGRGHEAEFVSYRDKVIDTVLGPVALTRAWYHCAACGHGHAPRDAELGLAGASMSPGLRR